MAKRILGFVVMSRKEYQRVTAAGAHLGVLVRATGGSVEQLFGASRLAAETSGNAAKQMKAEAAKKRSEVVAAFEAARKQAEEQRNDGLLSVTRVEQDAMQKETEATKIADALTFFGKK